MRLTTEDDRALFAKMFEIFSKEGSDALAQYLKEKVKELEG